MRSARRGDRGGGVSRKETPEAGGWGGGASGAPLPPAVPLVSRPSEALEAPSPEPAGPSPPRPEPQQPEASARLSANVRDPGVSRVGLCSGRPGPRGGH